MLPVKSELRQKRFEGLGRQQYLADVDAERRAYARRPETRGEKAWRACLRRQADHALATSGDEW